MNVNILAFGIVRDMFGAGSVSVDIGSQATVGSLKAHLENSFPRLTALSSFAIAVNGVYAVPETIIGAGDEIAIIPPVSGG